MRLLWLLATEAAYVLGKITARLMLIAVASVCLAAIYMVMAPIVAVIWVLEAIIRLCEWGYDRMREERRA